MSAPKPQQLKTTSGPAHVLDPRSPLSAVILRAALSVPRSCSLADAIEMMREQGVSSLLVDGRSGIVTERDLVRALAAGWAPHEPVGIAASWHPIVAPATTTVTAGAALMLNEQVRHLVVELDDGAIGVVSMRDLMAVLLQAVDSHLWLASLRMTIETPSEIWLG
jgi:CBS domain-containing protein